MERPGSAAEARGAVAKTENVFVAVRARLPADTVPQWGLSGNCIQREDAGFCVDRAYAPDATNADVFEDLVQVIDGVTEGVSGGVYAYGVRKGARVPTSWRCCIV